MVVGDVAGKGVPAALLMAKLSSDVRQWLSIEPNPAKALGQINQVFSGYGWDDRFVTMVVAVIDPAKNQLTLVNAATCRRSSERGGRSDGNRWRTGWLASGVVDDFEFEAYEHISNRGICAPCSPTASVRR